MKSSPKKGDSVKFTEKAQKEQEFPDDQLYYADTIVSEDGKKLYLLGGWTDEFTLASEEDVEFINDTMQQKLLNVMVDVAQTLKAMSHSFSEIRKNMSHQHDMMDDISDEEMADLDREDFVEESERRKKRPLQ